MGTCAAIIPECASCASVKSSAPAWKKNSIVAGLAALLPRCHQAQHRDVGFRGGGDDVGTAGESLGVHALGVDFDPAGERQVRRDPPG